MRTWTATRGPGCRWARAPELWQQSHGRTSEHAGLRVPEGGHLSRPMEGAGGRQSAPLRSPQSLPSSPPELSSAGFSWGGRRAGEGLGWSQAWAACLVPKDGLPGGPAETESEEPGRGTALQQHGRGLTSCGAGPRREWQTQPGHLPSCHLGTLLNFQEPQCPVHHLGTLAPPLGHGWEDCEEGGGSVDGEGLATAIHSAAS